MRNRHNGNQTFYEEAEYTIYSSVTGQKITSLTSNGSKYQTFVYLGSSVIAEQNYAVNSSELVFKQNDPVTQSEMQTQLSGELSPNGLGRVDREALGAVVPPQETEEFPLPDYKRGGSTSNPESGCQLNYAPVSCSQMTSYYTGRGGSLLGGMLIDVSVWRYDRYSVYDNESDEGNIYADTGENYAKVMNLLIFYDRSWYVTSINLIELPQSQADNKVSEKDKKKADNALALAFNALQPGTSCADLFDAGIMGISAQQLLENLRSKIEYVTDISSNNPFFEIAGQTSGQYSDNSIYFITDKNTGKTTKKQSNRPGKVNYIKLDVDGTFLYPASYKDIAYWLIHELGHGADFLYGDSGSKIINDAGNKQGSANMNAEKANDKTMQECKKYLNQISKTRKRKV